MVALLLVLAEQPAVAQTQDKVAAEALFEQARQLMTAGSYAEACSKFEQSQRLDPGIGTLLYLADCYEKTKRIASAWATFREGASEARAAGQSDRAEAGGTRADALEPRLSKLTIVVAKENANIPDISIVRGDRSIPTGVWGVAVPVDGGKYLVLASAPGYHEWQKTVTVQNERDAVKVEVPALVKDASAKAVPATPPPPEQPPVVVQPPPTRDTGPTDDGSTQRTIGIAAVGVGVVGLGFGTFFGLRAISKNSDAKDLCDGTVCHDQNGVTLTDDAKTAATISNIAFGIGLAGVAGGIVLYLTAPSAPSQGRLHVSPLAARRGGGLSLGGSF